MISKLDSLEQLQLSSEFDLHCVPFKFSLWIHLSYALKTTIKALKGTLPDVAMVSDRVTLEEITTK